MKYVIIYKRFFFNLLAFFILFLSAYFGVALLVDPIGIWGTPLIPGFNHYKVKQSLYEDIFKVYEVMRVQPDVVYVGASIVDQGFDTESDEACYNMGIPSGRLWDAREYLRFIYKTCTPKRIYLCISPWVFSKQAHNSKRPNFSQTRMQHLAGNSFEYGYQILKDTMSIHDALLPTIAASIEHLSDLTIFRLGWNSRGRESNTIGIISKEGYYSSIGTLIDNHKKVELSSEAFNCFVDIVNEAKDHNVSLCVSFAPTSVDLYAIFHLFGDEIEFQKIKRKVSTIIPVYDFYFVNGLSTNRNDNFYDIGHFRTPVGEKLKLIMEGKAEPEPCGYLLTPESVDTTFAMEAVAWEKWCAENTEYVRALTECIELRRKPKFGEFAYYIGF